MPLLHLAHGDQISRSDTIQLFAWSEMTLPDKGKRVQTHHCALKRACGSLNSLHARLHLLGFFVCFFPPFHFKLFSVNSASLSPAKETNKLHRWSDKRGYPPVYQMYHPTRCPAAPVHLLAACPAKTEHFVLNQLIACVSSFCRTVAKWKLSTQSISS